MKSLFLFLVATSLLVSCKENTQKTQVAEQTTVKETAKVPVTDCRNCGMPSKEYPKWNVKCMQEQQERYFCSPRCMFMQVTKAESPINVQDSLQVVDYYNQKFIDARTAFFVINSDITGPMGHDFVPFADQVAAKDFLQEHKGSAILTFATVNGEVIKNLGK